MMAAKSIGDTDVQAICVTVSPMNKRVMVQINVQHSVHVGELGELGENVHLSKKTAGRGGHYVLVWPPRCNWVNWVEVCTSHPIYEPNPLFAPMFAPRKLGENVHLCSEVVFCHG